MNKYAEIILPLPLRNNTFTYCIPDTLLESIKIGSRVIVPFGAKKYYTGIVQSTHNNSESKYDIKDIESVLDTEPVVTTKQLELWQWIAQYYMCSMGEVYKAALPTGMRIESETTIQLCEEYDAENKLTDKEKIAVSYIVEKKKAKITELSKHLNIKNALPVVRSLIEKGIITISEELKEQYRAKTEDRIRLKEGIGELELTHLLDKMSRTPKQKLIIEEILNIGRVDQDREIKDIDIAKKELIERTKCSTTTLQQLIEKGIVEIYKKQISRLEDEQKTSELSTLNAYQKKAFDEIVDSFITKNVCLLNGVTSSGKTEIYTHLIQQQIDRGKQVLYLLPEIALTTQITKRLKKIFGGRLGIYHSKFADADRVEVWQKMLTDNAYDIILGVRSSVFLPFKDLGLVIIDEEHEASYKQQDPAPRYNGKNTAMILSQMFNNSKVLLGTATPSAESWFMAKKESYGLVNLTKRHEGVELPTIELVDIKELYRKKRMNGMFSLRLIEAIKEAINKEEQVILFQNRRGFAPMMECNICGWTPRCVHCDVSLTYHKRSNILSCHYCGKTYRLVNTCPACESKDITDRGGGTEKVEEELLQIFPGIRTLRMDLDTAKTKASYEKIIEDFANKKADVLIGTQMISKGLDFDNVSLVGIMNADSMLNYPDFRAYERAFQLMAQVSGRAGRRDKQGKVILQAKNVENKIITQITENNYQDMIEQQFAERKDFTYPPYCKMIYIYIKHRDEKTTEAFAEKMAVALKKNLAENIWGVTKPVISRIQSLYIRRITIKTDNSKQLNNIKQHIIDIEEYTRQSNSLFKSVNVYYDVDPM